MSNAAFKTSLGEMLDKAGDKADQVVRLLCLRIATAVVMRSPVDTGRFRSNWQYGTDGINTTVTEDTDMEGTGTVGRIGGLLNSWSAGQMIYLTNSLPYAKRLEYGHSHKQAPGGMVRVTVAEYAQHLGESVSAIA